MHSHATPPERIGAYRLQTRIGEGGMGEVWLAWQEEPVRRQVALKLLHHEGLTPSRRLRFEIEKRALARMSHPSIVQIHDEGTTEEGRPYLVMDYIDGRPITTFVQDQNSSLRERLRLFLATCDAVSHAHQRAILHRDLKPANVLVTMIDGNPQVKVVDFGLARMLEDEDTGNLTSSRMVLGTPGYQSPEQARLDRKEIDVRSDVFSLGALLHEVLVDEGPFTGSNRTPRSAGAILRAIQEDDAPRPSVVVQRRQNSALARKLRGELDWIVLRALEKSKDRRYASVADFADDLRRHLNGDPVMAGPRSLRYRLGKAVRKHKAFAMAGGLIVAALLVSLPTSFGSAVNARVQTAVTERNTKETTLKIGEILGLGDRKKLRDLASEAKSLRPVPRMVEAMESWLARGQDLLSHRESHRRTLARLSSLVEADPFADWQRGELKGLIDSLEEFDRESTGLVAVISARLERARTLRARSIDYYRDTWDAACTLIADATECPDYSGLRIEAQVGLVPLGRDPRSGLWEFGHIETGDLPQRDEEGNVVVTEGTGIVLVLVPGGTFRMGATKGDPLAKSWEYPAHDLTLDPYFLSKYEITQGQWQRATGANPSRTGPGTVSAGVVFDLRHPMENVGWDECRDVLAELDLEMPTEAQWELAARAGTTTRWWTGDDPLSLQGAANLADRTAQGAGAAFPVSRIGRRLRDGNAGHAPVGSLLPNPFGFHDVAGNVWEWVVDRTGQYELPVATDTGRRLLTTPGASRIMRGGAYDSDVGGARSSQRGNLQQEGAFPGLGVRPARRLDR